MIVAYNASDHTYIPGCYLLVGATLVECEIGITRLTKTPEPYGHKGETFNKAAHQCYILFAVTARYIYRGCLLLMFLKRILLRDFLTRLSPRNYVQRPHGSSKR